MAGQISKAQQNAHLPKSADSDNLGISVSAPKYPQYAVMTKRLESFKEWPTNVGIKPELLAEAGLVYTGGADAVRCYHCGGGLRNWDPGDDPWREHAKWYNHCPYILLVKGQSFVDDVFNDGPIDQNSSQHIEDPPQEKVVEDLMETAAALSCTQMGYKRDYVEKAVRTYVDVNGHSNFKGVDIAKLCEEFGELDLRKRESALGNLADFTQQAIARYNSVESDTEDGRNICTRRRFRTRHRHVACQTARMDSPNLLTTSSSLPFESQAERGNSCLIIRSPPSMRQRAYPGRQAASYRFTTNLCETFGRVAGTQLSATLMCLYNKICCSD